MILITDGVAGAGSTMPCLTFPNSWRADWRGWAQAVGAGG